VPKLQAPSAAPFVADTFNPGERCAHPHRHRNRLRLSRAASGQRTLGKPDAYFAAARIGRLADAVDRGIGETSGVEKGGVLVIPGASKGESCTGTEEVGASADRDEVARSSPFHLRRREHALLDALGAVSISTDRWYRWPVVPLVGWTLVLALHVWHVYGREK
jgi:hypothetical protein